MTQEQSAFQTPDRGGDTSGADAQHDIKPWEQRAGSGMGGGGVSQRGEEATRVCEATSPDSLPGLLQTFDNQIDFAGLQRGSNHTTPDTNLTATAETNTEVWRQFLTEHLYDTRRVTLEHFHLFEWFPLSPGVFHTPKAAFNRAEAYRMLERDPGGQYYYSPPGKAIMVRGGIGAVRLRPVTIKGEDRYFMTASSSGICHEGFPVLVPRQLYGQVKPRLLDEGAVPVRLSGEMRFITENKALRLFGTRRDIPLLYLHVDDLIVLPRPRSDITRYEVSVVATFYGEYGGHRGPFITYATFDPASQTDLGNAITWIEQFYVTGLYDGQIITDFDDVRPRFPQAVFGLQSIRQGTLNEAWVRDLLIRLGLETRSAERITNINTYINTGGGAYVAGSVRVTDGGDFVGRDKTVQDQGGK